MTMRTACLMASMVAVGVGALSGCKRGDDETMRRLSEANDKVVACKREVDDLRKEIATLKHQLAQAMANPGKINLTDPEVINLIADIRASHGGAPAGGEKPSLDPQEASKVVFQGARAMQTCYERALKKNQALQYQAGVGLTLDITVRSAGTVDAVEINPSVDREMTACIKTAAMRWKFPTFQGESVVVSQKVTLTPKT
jgi:NAD(P)-dependent dehydrogenase (short-subunit alcohol dehydrogenase family)